MALNRNMYMWWLIHLRTNIVEINNQTPLPNFDMNLPSFDNNVPQLRPTEPVSVPKPEEIKKPEKPAEDGHISVYAWLNYIIYKNHFK